METTTQKIPSGYKQTEIGVIPADWDVKRLDELFSISAGRDLVIDSFSNVKTEQHPFPVYSNSLENSGLYGYTKTARHNGNSITITARGMIGKANTRDHDFDAIGRLLVLSPKKELDCFFVSEYINNRVIFSIENTSVSQLTAPQASQYLVVYPNPKEQRVVASVLQDADKLIAKLKKLIEKKKNIKQGTMQELLTGKRRLPGFSGKWQTKRLDEVAEFERGRDLPKSDMSDEGAYKCIHYGQLFTEYKELVGDIKSRTHSNAGRFYSKENDVLMPTSDVTPRGLATASCIKESGVILGGGILVVRFNAGYDGLFFSYFVSQNKASILKLVKGSTVFHLYASDLANLEVNFPEPDEQTAIATIISDMDAEIEKLESELAKYQDIKQGMMQTLLTGKIRLK